jgi:hypothetical protein
MTRGWTELLSAWERMSLRRNWNKKKRIHFIKISFYFLRKVYQIQPDWSWFFAWDGGSTNMIKSPN